MKDSDWKILYQLHQTPNITRVADQLYITQSALTRRLQAIEEELGTRIVIRSTKGVQFTPEGEYLSKEAAAHLRFRSGVSRNLEDFRKNGIGTIRIASSYTFSEYYLPALIAEFRQTHPDVSFDIRSMRSDHLTELLSSGVSDLAIVRGGYESDLYRRKLMTEAGWLVSYNPIENKEQLLRGRIEPDLGESSRKLIDRWWKENFDREPSGIIHIPFIDGAFAMLEQGLGYMAGFFSEETLKKRGFWYQPLVYKDGSPVERDTWLVYSRETRKTEYVTEFIDLMEKRF